MNFLRKFRYLIIVIMLSILIFVYKEDLLYTRLTALLSMTDWSVMPPEELRAETRFCNLTEHNKLPNITVIKRMDIDSLYLTYSRYIKRRQVRCCNVSRAGPKDSFGKNICLDTFKKGQDKCIVYSFGSQFHFEFETAIWEDHRCEIHVFDPSMSTEGEHIPSFVNFHLTGLSNKDEIAQVPGGSKGNQFWKMQSFMSIRKSLKHTKSYIDILKIDIEGWEWNVLEEILQPDVMKYVKQICLEVHFGYRLSVTLNYRNRITGYRFINSTWGNIRIHDQLQILNNLYDSGFRIFMSDPLTGWATYKLKHTKESIDTLIEISLLNMNID